MLYCFGFDTLAVAVGDLYHFDELAEPDQLGAERGVRLEIRALERQELLGSVYSAQPIRIAEPIWRVDLLETVDGPPGSFDRTHHHPRFKEWEPGDRIFDRQLSGEPVAWVGERLTNVGEVLSEAGVDDVSPAEMADVQAAVPEILTALERLLDRVQAGELAVPPAEVPTTSTRLGWL
jgi:hypothetical protein